MREPISLKHTAPSDALVTSHDGDRKIWMTGIKFFLKAGETIIIPAGPPYALSVITNFKKRIFMSRE